MIASADGRATVDGRSVGLGHPDDRALLRELRTGADAVLAGSGTLVAEGYRNLLDPGQRAYRRAHGLREHPVVATVSRDLGLRAADVPLFAEDGVEIAVYSERTGDLGPAVADVHVHTVGPFTFPAILAHLGRVHGVGSVACEGGPGLLREMIAQDCVDDLLLTVAPYLVAGTGPTPLTGRALVPPGRMRLRAVHRSDDHLFLHYAR